MTDITTAAEGYFSDLTARLAAADRGWALLHGDPPANPDYIRFLSRQVDAFEGYIRNTAGLLAVSEQCCNGGECTGKCRDCGAAPITADDEAAIEEAIFTGWQEFIYPRASTDEPSGSFKRGVRATLAALKVGKT